MVAFETSVGAECRSRLHCTCRFPPGGLGDASCCPAAVLDLSVPSQVAVVARGSPSMAMTDLTRNQEVSSVAAVRMPEATGRHWLARRIGKLRIQDESLRARLPRWLNATIRLIPRTITDGQLLREQRNEGLRTAPGKKTGNTAGNGAPYTRSSPPPRQSSPAAAATTTTVVIPAAATTTTVLPAPAVIAATTATIIAAVAVTRRSRLDPPYAAAECAASKGAHARRRTGRLRASADTVHGLDCGRHSDSDHRLRRPHSRGQTGSVSLQPVRAREPTHKHMAGLRLGAARAVWTADLGRKRPLRKSTHALERPPPPIPSWSTALSGEAVAASIPLNPSQRTTCAPCGHAASSPGGLQ